MSSYGYVQTPREVRSRYVDYECWLRAGELLVDVSARVVVPPVPPDAGTPPSLQTVLPCFSANKGNGGVFNQPFPNLVNDWAEIFDTVGNFDPVSGVFIAPFTGKYRFSYTLSHDTSVALNDRYAVAVTTPNRSYNRVHLVAADDFGTVVNTVLVDMEAGHTAVLTVARSVGTGSFRLIEDARYNWFQGEMVSGDVPGVVPAPPYTGFDAQAFLVAPENNRVQVVTSGGASPSAYKVLLLATSNSGRKREISLDYRVREP